ncbi:UPF0175 family protein [Candidatus Woesearchaeota archaeon]|nr:UPF0175 family protein [Candidatus Woesearchaeota archaeon]MBI2660747.1 UPF0175 family protein [Candidatus Woesearchaeota archaeon]
MDKGDYEFVKRMAKENQEEISKTIRELVDLGRLMYAIENYKKGKISIGRAAEQAGISISEIMNILAEFGIRSKIGYEDYLEGLNNLKKVW